MINYDPTESDSTEKDGCACHGQIASCLYCQGTGRVNEQHRQQAAHILAHSRVLQCPSCGQQQRVMQERLLVAEPLLCRHCQSPLLSSATSLWAMLRKSS